MTGFALTLWIFKRTGSVLSVSLLAVCSYLPFILFSVFAGAFVDTHRKKAILVVSDSVAAVCSATVWILYLCGMLEIWNIYVVNLITGFLSASQAPAASVAIGLIVPKDKVEKVSGMNSFTSSLIEVIKPALATAIMTFMGLQAILLIDLITFFLAFITLLFFIHIPEKIEMTGVREKESLWTGTKVGFQFLKGNRGLLNIIISMAIINLFSRLTYENILTPMLIARSNGNQNVAGIVGSVMGLTGILSGLLVTVRRLPKDKVKVIYFGAAFSFLAGDLMMGIGQNVVMWSIAGVAATLPFSMINAGMNVIFYSSIPQNLQGRVFAVRNCLQYITIPIGLILGGYLAEYVFNPFMEGRSTVAIYLQRIVGHTGGSGMAVMFLITGVCGFITSILWYRNKDIQSLKRKA